jgi:hypothetical protein
MKQDVCAYCGAPNPTSRDHIPPAGIFGEPRPSDLITVPSCFACNNGASKDDEYFRLVVSATVDPDVFRDAHASFQAALRNLRRPQAARFNAAIRAAMTPVTLDSPAGPVRTGAITVESDRISRVTSRIIAGLYYHHRGVPVPSMSSVWSTWVGAVHQKPGTLDALELFRTGVPWTPGRTIGAATFRYAYFFFPGYDVESAWLLSFFDHVAFIGLINPEVPA